MNKKDYVALHALLAKLKYEVVYMSYMETDSEEFEEELDAIDKVMQIFIVDMEE